MNLKPKSRLTENLAHSHCYVDKTDVLDDLILDATMTRNHHKTTAHIHNRGQRSHTADGVSSGGPNEISFNRQREMQAAQREHQEMLSRKMVEKALRERTNRRDSRFNWILNDVDHSREVLDEVDRGLKLFHETNRNKKRHQFEEWNANVHGAIQRKISTKVDAISTKELNQRKNADYAKFLDITNRKAAIFLDIIIESEYDPLEPNLHGIRTATRRLKDPTHVSKQKYEEENSMLGVGGGSGGTGGGGGDGEGEGGGGGSSPARHKSNFVGGKTKDMLPVEQWAAGKIEGTPYGSFAKMMVTAGSAAASGEGGTSAAPKKKAGQKSTLVLDHYNYPRTRASVDAEMPRGKRIHPATTYAEPGRIFSQLPVREQQEIAEIRPPDSKAWTVSEHK